MDPEEQKVDTSAALLLYSWQFLKTASPKRLPKVEQQLSDEEITRTPLPEFPPIPALNGLIGRCSRPYEKQLMDSDVKDDQARLALYRDHAVNYLRPLLGQIMENNLEDKGIPVTLYDSDGKGYEMKFKLWGKMYVLTGKKWNDFHHDHNFVKLENWVTYWMFKHNRTQKWCFALTSRRLGTTAKLPVKRINGSRKNGGETSKEKRLKKVKRELD